MEVHNLLQAHLLSLDIAIEGGSSPVTGPVVIHGNAAVLLGKRMLSNAALVFKWEMWLVMTLDERWCRKSSLDHVAPGILEKRSAATDIYDTMNIVSR